MALGVTILKHNVVGASRHRLVKFVADAAYAAGGYVLDPADVELDTVDAVNVHGVSSGGYVMTYLPSTGKLKCLYGDNNNASDGPLIETPDNTSGLSGQTFYATVEGDQVNDG